MGWDFAVNPVGGALEGAAQPVALSLVGTAHSFTLLPEGPFNSVFENLVNSGFSFPDCPFSLVLSATLLPMNETMGR